MIMVNPVCAVDVQEGPTEAKWCSCRGEAEQEKCLLRSTYFENHACDCGVEHHHYHGGLCGGITQIG